MVDLQDPRTIKLSGATEQALSQLSDAMAELNERRPFDDEVAARLRDILLPDRIVASLNMEGIIATRRQTIDTMHAMRIQEGINRSEREIYNTLQADEFVHTAVEHALMLDERFIREINRLLLEGLRQDAGAFRAGAVELPGAPFAPPEPSDIPQLVRSLADLFPLADAAHPVVQAAWLHAQFTKIHPFADGNGRGGRLLQDWALIRRGYLPVGIPPSQRDDYYGALEQADRGRWDDFVELIALLQLSLISRVQAIVQEHESRAKFISRLATAAAAKNKNTRHKAYLVWRKRMEQLSRTFAQACRELDDASSVIGATFRDYGVVDFREWDEICRFGHINRSWLFSIIFYAEGHPFYKAIAFVKRHGPIPSVDHFEPPRDAVALYFTGTALPDGPRPEFVAYDDPHVRLREVLFLGDHQYLYRQEAPDEDWVISELASYGEVVEGLFMDIFERKAGLEL